MMSYQKTNSEQISQNEILIIGLGGAGTNIINSVNKYGLRGGETLAISADVRTLNASKVKNKIQMGAKFRRGLACGGDPALGLKSAQESESEIRDQIKGKKIVFLCVGLGGGSGSGAAPLVTRLAREENAFVVVFATMPFTFEGARRRQQAESALNELAAIASALVTFDNGRMSELVAPNQSIHEAFEASNQLISSSILSISRIALYPGIVHIGLDDLVSTLSSKRSRCLFGAGSAKGKGRVERALKMALASPLIDKGKLLNTSERVIVHICGGSSTTLQETEQFMAGVVNNLGATAEIFFGISIDEEMGEEFTATIISSLPEEQVLVPDSPQDGEASEYTALVNASGESEEPVIEEAKGDKKLGKSEEKAAAEPAPEEPQPEAENEPVIEPLDAPVETAPVVESITTTPPDTSAVFGPFEKIEDAAEEEAPEADNNEEELEVVAMKQTTAVTTSAEDVKKEDPEPELTPVEEAKKQDPTVDDLKEKDSDGAEQKPAESAKAKAESEGSPIRRRFAHLFSGKDDNEEKAEAKAADKVTEKEEKSETPPPAKTEKVKNEKDEEDYGMKPPESGSKVTSDELFTDSEQAELFGEVKPKGRFEGETPNMHGDSDLDIPTFLRNSD